MDCQYHSRPHRLDTSRFDVTGLELLDFVIPPIPAQRDACPRRGIRWSMLDVRADAGTINASGASEQMKLLRECIEDYGGRRRGARTCNLSA